MKITDQKRPVVFFGGTSNNSNSIGGVAVSSNYSASSNSIIVSTSSNTAQWETGAGLFRLAYNLGQEGYGSLGTVGATVTVSGVNGNYQSFTLATNTVFTLTGWTVGAYCDLGIRITENGTGGFTPTFTGVTWVGGVTPTHVTTANTVTDYVFWSTDGGVTIYGGQVGAGSSSSSTTTTSSSDHVHVVGEPLTADGSSTTYYLANYPEDNSVAAYVNGIRTDVTQILDAITFSGTPPILAALRFDYLAEITS